VGPFRCKYQGEDFVTALLESGELCTSTCALVWRSEDTQTSEEAGKPFTFAWGTASTQNRCQIPRQRFGSRVERVKLRAWGIGRGC